MATCDSRAHLVSKRIQRPCTSLTDMQLLQSVQCYAYSDELHEWSYFGRRATLGLKTLAQHSQLNCTFHGIKRPGDSVNARHIRHP